MFSKWRKQKELKKQAAAAWEELGNLVVVTERLLDLTPCQEAVEEWYGSRDAALEAGFTSLFSLVTKVIDMARMDLHRRDSEKLRGGVASAEATPEETVLQIANDEGLHMLLNAAELKIENILQLIEAKLVE